MSKAVLVIEMPESCIDCPFHYKSEELELGDFTFKRLYRCMVQPEDAEKVYLKDIVHEKTNWCPLRELPEKRPYNGAEEITDKRTGQVIHETVALGWNACIDAITGGDE